MRTINKNRASILTKLYQKSSDSEDFSHDEPEDFIPDEPYAVNNLARKLLQEHFVCKEESYCIQCAEHGLPRYQTTLGIGATLYPDFTNFIDAIEESFPEGSCGICNQSVRTEREFQNFLFMEVSYFFENIF